MCITSDKKIEIMDKNGKLISKLESLNSLQHELHKLITQYNLEGDTVRALISYSNNVTKQEKRALSLSMSNLTIACKKQDDIVFNAIFFDDKKLRTCK